LDEFHLGKSNQFLRFFQALPRKFFGVFYHTYARQYEYVTQAISMGLWKTWLSTTLTYLNGPAILELGSDPGHLQKLLLESRIEGIGLDESQQMIDISRKRVEKIRTYPNDNPGSW
jgi:ubiquinone/menaquinone biosynthesis C-methylase UbiE